MAIPASLPKSPRAGGTSGNVFYFCPMCPGVEQDHPGNCPKCGMALESAGESVATTRTEYTCPMHPEIVQDHRELPQNAGMALEPRSIDVEEKTKSSLI